KQKHATLAQSLGIECGVKPIADPCDLDPNECKLNQICDKATTEISGKKSWDESAEAYVSFAKKFGLNCNILAEKNEKVIKKQANKANIISSALPCDKNPAACISETLCKKATYESYGEKIWESSFNKHVKEAKQRGLTCGVGVKKNKLNCGQDTQNCKNSELCGLATNTDYSYSNKIYYKVWEKNTALKKYIVEAKKRGLSCGVTSIPINNNGRNIENAFKVKPKVYRQKLQYALKQLQLYSYDIDGLWGKGTSKGLNKFIRSQNLENNTEALIFLKLLTKVDIPTDFAARAECSWFNPQNCNDYRLCRYASTIAYKNDGPVRWKTANTQSAIKAKAEAIRRGLNCGVVSTKSSPKLNKKIKIQKEYTSPKNNNAGLTAIISNPSISGMQALAICRPQAKLAKSQGRASARSSGNNRRRTYNLDCTFGTCTVRDKTPSGGFMGGFLKGMTEGMAGKNAYNAVMDSCLAEYGWRD
ncbi:hypothetical protein N8370_10845, partial [Amylibacter sp.]|nr:hypothetical protein [Amylibacter sp.]